MRKPKSKPVLRNSCQPYIIMLQDSGIRLRETDLNPHIDWDTLEFKPWESPSIEIISKREGHMELYNSSYGVRYILTIATEDNRLLVSCNCNRKVEKLCHHAYHGLMDIIIRHGIFYFK